MSKTKEFNSFYTKKMFMQKICIRKGGVTLFNIG